MKLTKKGDKHMDFVEIIETKSLGPGIVDVTKDFVLYEKPRSRLVFHAQIHKKGIKGKIIRQRRESKDDLWIPEKAIDIRTLGKNESINIELDTKAVNNFFSAIQQSIQILSDRGIEPGEHKYAVFDPETVIITEKNKVDCIKKLLDAGYGQEVWDDLTEKDPSLATKLAYARIYSERVKTLEEFSENINCDKDEGFWQSYFNENPWIFGYGLDYQFRGILQKECFLSNSNIDGTNEVIGDFLLGDKRFTSFIELKKPNTKLFKNKQNRSNSWSLSSDLIDSVTQILEQKASGQIKIEKGGLFIDNGKKLAQHSFDSKVFLIIGSWKEIENCSDQEREIKEKTFELFRRDSRNIEIITYDELLDRAKFIVNNTDSKSLEGKQVDLEDYEFISDDFADL
jgi:hypothetical protein